MAALTSEQRDEVTARLMRLWSSRNEEFDGPSTKHDLRTAIGDADAELDSQQATLKAAISNPVNTDASNKQIVEIYLEVIKERYKVGV